MPTFTKLIKGKSFNWVEAMLNSNAWMSNDAVSTQLSPNRSLGGHASSPERLNQRNDVGVGPPRSPRPARPPRFPAHRGATAETVLKSFNTWAFKREQPADPDLLLQTVARAVSRGEPVPFVLYWGKGPRCTIDAHDAECLDHLVAMARRLQAVYDPGAAINLIFTDSHAALNGYSPASMNRYFAEIDTAARQRGFASCRLGELTPAAADVAAGAVEETVSEDMMVRLCASAMKWYRGEQPAREAALKYFEMNMIEKRAVERAFPHAIFATFNGSKFRCLFPQHMPIFYMYSLRRGVSVKPWFLPAEAKRCDDPACECASVRSPANG